MQPYFQNRKYRKIFYRRQTNDDCEIHFHRDIEIIHVVSGSLEMTVRGETKQLSSGDMMIASSNESHGFVTVGQSEFRVFIIPAEIVSEYMAQTVDQMLTTPFLLHSDRTKKLIELTETLVPYTRTDITLTAIGYVYTILGTFIEELGFVAKTNTEKTKFILEKMLLYIEEHFQEPLQIADLANYFGYHKDYLSKIFNMGVGCNFNCYVNTLRVRHARNLIVQKKMTLDEICTASGFQSTHSFRRVFTNYYGQSPYQYQRSLKNKNQQ